jgi:uncharacterized repeat protein (TIGR01451 family)
MKTTLRLSILFVLVLVQALAPASAGAKAETAAAPSMPPALYSAFLDATAKGAPVAHAQDGGLAWDTPDLKTKGSAAGLSVAPQSGNAWTWNLQLDGFGRQGQVASLSALKVTQAGGRMELSYTTLSEWYRETGIGLEQGFTINQKPAGNGELMLHMQLDTSLSGAVSADNRSVIFASRDGQRLHYSDLYAYDANGQELGATLAYDPRQIILQIDDRGATYPLTVDPLIYLEAERVGMDSVTGDDFGVSVAVSGSTAVIGAQFHKVGSNTHQGVAYVFARSGMTWGQQAELSASDGAANDHFGYYVAISGDTAVIGAPDRNSSRGEAYVFVKPAGGWASGHETAKLTASDGAAGDDFGYSVAISGDSAIIGAKGHNSNQGEAYVFVKPAGGWASGTETARLTASDGGADDGLGISVAISGNTAVVGADGHNLGQGEAYVFLKPAGGWATGHETAKLTASDGVSSDGFGQSVAISGNTVVVGAYAYNSNQGKAYVFVKPAGGWVTGTERAKLTASDGASDNYFGASVAISGDTAVVGAFAYSFDEGNAYVFVKPAGGWASGTENYQLSASDGVGNDYFGYSVAISAEAAVVGAFNHNSQKGAAYMYFPYRSDQDLGVGAMASPATATPGQVVTFTASVTNYGPATAPAVLLSAPLPAGFTFVKSIASRGSYDPSTGSWSAGALAFGITATLDIQATVKAGTGGTNPAFTPRLLGSDINNTNNTASAVMHIPLLSFSPSALTFANQLIQTASPAQGVTITNLRSGSVKFGTLALPAGFGFSSNTCSGATVAASGHCIVKVQLKPVSAVAYSGNLTIPTTSPASSSSLPVSGHGLAGTQLLTNASFETCSGTPPVPTGWAKGGTWVTGDGCDTSQKHTGSRSFKLTGTNVIKSLTFTKTKSGVAGDDFLFSVWRKAASVPAGATLDAHIRVYSGTILKATKTVTLPVGTYGFTQSSLPFTMTSAYTKLVVTLEYKGATGTLWFDDASLVWAP